MTSSYLKMLTQNAALNTFDFKERKKISLSKNKLFKNCCLFKSQNTSFHIHPKPQTRINLNMTKERSSRGWLIQSNQLNI